MGACAAKSPSGAAASWCRGCGREGTTENATVCKALLADLRERGLDLEQAVLFVIDGGTGLRKAIRETCGPTAVVQRCQVHYADQRIMPSATCGALWDKDVMLMRSA